MRHLLVPVAIHRPAPQVHVALAAVGGIPGPSAAPAAPGPPSTVLNLPTDQVDPGLGGSSLPGSAYLHGLAGSIGSWALVAAVVGIFVGGIIWAFGSYSQNYQQAYNGRKGVLVSVLAALLIGAGPYLVRFFYTQGRGLS